MSDVERLATLESDTRYVKQKLDKIDSDVEEIKRGLNKQKGFIAGIMFVIVPVWTAAIVFAREMWDKITS